MSRICPAQYHDDILYLSVSLGVHRTYVSLQHGIMLLLGTQALLQYGDVLLIVLVLLL